MEYHWKLFRRAGALFVVACKYQQAEACWKKALEVAQQHLTAMHVRLALEDLAALYWLCGKTKEAETAILAVLNSSERELGASHPDVAMLLKNLAMIYEMQGQYVKSAECFRRALGILATIYGSKHTEVKNLLPGYANVLAKLDKVEEANSLRQAAATSVQRTWVVSGSWLVFGQGQVSAVCR